MNHVICVYDNSARPAADIRGIVGDKSFGEVILRRRSVRDKFYESVAGLAFLDEVFELNTPADAERLLQRLAVVRGEVNVLHVFSAAVAQGPAARLVYEKARYVQTPLVVKREGASVLFMMRGAAEYARFLRGNLAAQGTALSLEGFDEADTQEFFVISGYTNFMQYISGGFDARFFNSVQGDAFTVTKSSRDKRKMKAEYTFYHLLPDEMKPWFVLPYHYTETEDSASYTMERCHMTDLAVRWVHGAIGPEECAQLLREAFYFIEHRAQKQVGAAQAQSTAQALYLDKLDARIAQLKGHAEYPRLAALLASGTEFGGIDALAARYKALYARLAPRRAKESTAVIGHGDLCFSNMLYSCETDTLRLIDPKGATCEEELWTDPYYDVAKLSHSICGRYDFFNNALFTLALEKGLRFSLSIEFDNTAYMALFRACCAQSGFDFALVRLYEASLFLSMLPLHMDNPQKVFGFVLNADKILDEVEACLAK